MLELTPDLRILCLVFFMVFIVNVDRPQGGFVGVAGNNVFHSEFGGEHGMVLVVVAVHSVAAD